MDTKRREKRPKSDQKHTVTLSTIGHTKVSSSNHSKGIENNENKPKNTTQIHESENKDAKSDVRTTRSASATKTDISNQEKVLNEESKKSSNDEKRSDEENIEAMAQESSSDTQN